MNTFVADPHWGWWIVWYFYLGGIAAGAYFLATLVELFGSEADRPLARVGYRIALPLVALCGVFLIVDLDRPERFWHMILQSERVDEALAEGWPLSPAGWGAMVQAPMLKYWSPMSIGAWAVLLFGFFSGLSFLGTFWPEGRLARLLHSRLLGAAFQVVGCGVGFFLAAYTGVLLTATNQPVWSGTDWIGALFLTSAASTGMAAVLLLALARGRVPQETLERLERADLWAILLELGVFMVFLASLGAMLGPVLQSWPGQLLVLGTLLLALLIPLGLHLLPAHTARWHTPAAALFALAGGFVLRYGIVMTPPELLGQRPALPSSDEPSWAAWQCRLVVAAALLLALAIPWGMRRRLGLSAGKTALAVVAGLLVTGVTLVYALVPPGQLREAFAAVGLSGFSPEAGRQRGGGFGGSMYNRPDNLEPPSKIPQAGQP